MSFLLRYETGELVGMGGDYNFTNYAEMYPDMLQPGAADGLIEAVGGEGGDFLLIYSDRIVYLTRSYDNWESSANYDRIMAPALAEARGRPYLCAWPHDLGYWIKVDTTVKVPATK